MRTIVVANQKGGCGKTTVSINLAASLARECRRTLLIDLDPQAHCALGMAVPEEQIDLSILDCLLGQLEGEPIELSKITWQISPNLDVAPSRANLATLEPKLGTRDGTDGLLNKLLERNTTKYDYCVVDCPPHLGLLMRNGLLAADEIIIPVDTGYFSLYGLTQQLATLEHMRDRNPKKSIVRVLANQYDVRTKLAREILAELRKRFDKTVYDSIINFNTKLKESASFGQPITEFAPTSMGARDFKSLALEIMAQESTGVMTAELLEHVERLSADADRLLATTAVLVQDPAAARIGDIATVEPSPQHKAAEPQKRMASPVKPPAVAAKIPQQVQARSSAETVSVPKATPPPVMPLIPAPPKATEVKVPSVPAPISAGRPDDKRAATGPPPSMVQSATPSVPKTEPTPHVEIDRKITEIYGVHQEGDVVVFRNRNVGASEVQVAGDFNDWMPHTTPMRRLAAGEFEARLRLPKGRYRYRLVVDGRWSHDRENPMVETNEYGELNSIIEVSS